MRLFRITPRGSAIVSSLLLALLLGVAFSQESKLPVRVVQGPIVLHGGINSQWGGHTYCYTLLGKRALYWTATEYASGEFAHTALIGQHPLDGSDLPPHVTRLTFDPGKPNEAKTAFPRDPRVRVNQPQMVRTPDGHLHVFLGLTQPTKNPDYSPGRLRYYRTERPGDVSTLVDRSALIPTEPFRDFHLRMSVGISRDGKRLALVILAISEDGSIPFNTPVVFLGKRQGLDFAFQQPIRYAEPMGLFYPQVAATEEGVVIVGEVWDNQKRATTRLIHLDWQGQELHREDLPAETDGQFFSHDLRPRSADDWSRLVLYYNKAPADRSDNRHEFWEYDARTRRLRLLRSIKTEYGLANAGRWLPLPGGKSVFINNPSMNRLFVWSGNLLGQGEIIRSALPGADVVQRGYRASIYMSAPNVLQGSIRSPEELYLAADCYNPVKEGEKPAACSLLLWRLATSGR